MMKTNILLVIGLVAGFLSGCAQMSSLGTAQGNKIPGAAHHAGDYGNHDALAMHHENIAKEMQDKLQAQKKLLEEYEEHSYYYGRRGQDLQSHTTANIRQYEKSIKENLKEAAIHRKMAQEEKGQQQDIGLIHEKTINSQLN